MDVFNSEGFDECCTEAYGKIRADLEKNGTVIGPNDLMIAATVIRKGGVLVTHNTKEFSRIEGLRIEDWTEADRSFWLAPMTEYVIFRIDRLPPMRHQWLSRYFLGDIP